MLYIYRLYCRSKSRVRGHLLLTIYNEQSEPTDVEDVDIGNDSPDEVSRYLSL